MSLHRSLAALVVGLVLGLGVITSGVSAAASITVEWVPTTSPFVAYADGGRSARAQPSFRVTNTTAQLLHVDAKIKLDPPEAVGPENAPTAFCEQTIPNAGETVTGSCSFPVTPKQVADGTVIHVSIAYTASDDDGNVVATGTTDVLDVIGMPSPASLSVAIDTVPSTVVVAPADLTIAYDVENTGTVDFDAVALEVRVDVNRAGPPGRIDCETTLGALAIGATDHETCQLTFDPEDASRFPVRVTVVARGTAGDLVPTASDSVNVPLVVSGPHLEVDLLETGLRDTRPAPGDTFALEIQVYNVGSERLDVTTLTDPVAPDCARDLGAFEPTASVNVTCDFLVPADTTVCRMPYTVFAHGVTADDQTTEASIQSGADLTQPDDLCGSTARPSPPATDVSTATWSSSHGTTPGPEANALTWIVLLAVAGTTVVRLRGRVR